MASLGPHPPWQKPRLLITRLYTPPIQEETSRRARTSSTSAPPGAEVPSGTRKCPLLRLSLTIFLKSGCEISKGLKTISACRQDKEPPKEGLLFPLGGLLTSEAGGRGVPELSPAGSRCATHTDLGHVFQTSLLQCLFL